MPGKYVVLDPHRVVVGGTRTYRPPAAARESRCTLSSTVNALVRFVRVKDGSRCILLLRFSMSSETI